MIFMADPSPDKPEPTPARINTLPYPRREEEAARSLPVRLLAGARWLAATWWRRLDFSDRAVLGVWIAAHIALLVLVWAAAWVYRGDSSHAPLTGAFQHWDANLLQNIAQYGYFSPHSTPNNAAFFPGYPLTLAAAHLLVRNWVLSELLVSGVAGCFAVVSLARLAGNRRVVLYLLTTPAAIFLMVGYAECLFLALAIPAWRAAANSRWWRAAVLAGLAGLVREDAVWLILALAVMALTGPRVRVPPTLDLRAQDLRDPWDHPVWQRLWNAITCCFGFAGPAAYLVYLRVCTGSWNTWTKAERVGWGLHTVTPLEALKTTYGMAFEHTLAAGYAFESQLEMAVVGLMILATLAFFWRRRWAEAVYCGLPAIAIGTQSFYHSSPRTLLTLFPICVALVGLEARRPWIRYLYFGISAPLAVLIGLLFLAGQWAG